MKSIWKIFLHEFFLGIILVGGCVYQSLREQAGFRLHCREMISFNPQNVDTCKFLFQKDDCKDFPYIFVAGLSKESTGFEVCNAEFRLYRLDGSLVTSRKFFPDSTWCFAEGNTMYFYDANLTDSFRHFPDGQGVLELCSMDGITNNVVIMLKETRWYSDGSPWREMPVVPVFHSDFNPDKCGEL